VTTKTIAKEPATQSMILYSVTKETISEMSAKYLPLTVAGIEDKEGLKVVKAARLLCRGARVAIEKTRKEAKEESLRYGQKVDAEAKRLTSLIEPIELHLTNQEELVEREIARLAKEKEDAVFAARHAMIVEAGGAVSEKFLRLMKEDEFLAELARVKIETLNRIEREAAEAIEKKRLADEAEALRLERAELARLRREQEELLAAERKKQDDAAAAQRAEQRRIDREREANDAERARLEAAAAAQRAEQDRLSREAASEVARLGAIGADKLARQDIAACVDTVYAAFSLPDDIAGSVAQSEPETESQSPLALELSLLDLPNHWVISRSAAVDAIRRLIEIGDVALNEDFRPCCRHSGQPLGDTEDESSI